MGDAMAITWRNMEDATVDMGPSFAITPAQKGTWVEIGVSDLVKTLSPNDAHLVLKLDCLASGSSQSHVLFGTSDTDKAPQLVKSDGTTANVLASQDAFVRGGKYKEVRYGVSNFMGIKKENNEASVRKGLVRFDLSGYDLSSFTRAVLRLHVKDIGRDTFRAITVSKLNNPDLDLHTVSWNTLDASQVTVGEAVTIHKNLKGRWIDFVVTDLLQSSTPIQTAIFLLENKGAARGHGWMQFDTLESDVNLAPQLILDALDSVADSTPSPTVSPTQTLNPTAAFDEFVIAPTQDAYLRGGIYQYSNFGTDPALVVKKDGNNNDNRDYDPKSILVFDTSRFNFQSSSTTLILLLENRSNNNPVTFGSRESDHPPHVIT